MHCEFFFWVGSLSQHLRSSNCTHDGPPASPPHRLPTAFTISVYSGTLSYTSPGCTITGTHCTSDVQHLYNSSLYMDIRFMPSFDGGSYVPWPCGNTARPPPHTSLVCPNVINESNSSTTCYTLLCWFTCSACYKSCVTFRTSTSLARANLCSAIHLSARRQVSDKIQSAHVVIGRGALLNQSLSTLKVTSLSRFVACI